MAQHTGRRPVDLEHPTRADVSAPFDWSGVKCEWNQNYCRQPSAALVETGATVMVAAQAPEGIRSERHLCTMHLRSFRKSRPTCRVIQTRPPSKPR